MLYLYNVKLENNLEGMNSPFQLAENIFVETTLNANANLNYCKLIVEKYDMQNDVFFSMRA